MKDLEHAKSKLEREVREMHHKLQDKDHTHQALKDEFQALQTISTATEEKMSALEKEYDQLVGGVCVGWVLCLCVRD